MRYDLVIFDLDNTLLDFDKMEAGCLIQTLKDYKLEANSDVLETYKAINTHYWEELEKGTYSKTEILELRFEKLFKELGYEASPSAFNKDYLEGMPNHIQLMDSAEEVLEYFYGKAPLIMMTNGVKAVQKTKMQKTGLGKYFDHVLISDEVGYHKPSIKIFEHMENLIGSVDKKKAIIIGDSLTSDIRGGNNYGIDTCWINPNGLNNLIGEQVDYEIRHLRELLDIL